MRNDFKYDLFISYFHEDEKKVKGIYDKLTRYGMRVFWAKRELPLGKSFPVELENALLSSQHFMLFFSEGASKSEWVRQESDTFLSKCHMKNRDYRRMYVLLDRECDPKHIPVFLQDINRPSNLDKLIADLLRVALGDEQEEIRLLKEQLEQQTRKLEEAQGYYRHRRFWSPLAANRDVHIFTCARDVAYNPNSSRGYGGRTNIDIWDYRAVLDISHFFASNYPNTKVTIEDPVHKLNGRDLEEIARLEQHRRQMKNLLADKDCIIVGSPDVSDFAELVLAQIHKITWYNEERIKRKGFVIIKEQKNTKSSFYWQKIDHEQEGVAEILPSGHYKYYPHVLASEDGKPGKMHGILVVANNPFCSEGVRRKVIILSGFSGVATNAIAKILTDDNCLGEFFRLDDACANTERDSEALIGVEYVINRNFADWDTRQVKDYSDTITFENFVEI